MEQPTTNKPYKTTFKHLVDMEQHVGKELGLTEWFTIDQAAITAFAKLTHDEQWIHVDPERAAKESPYKKTIAHGFMVLAFASKFAYETFEVQDAVMGVNYGTDKVRFISPTPVDARIRGRLSLEAFEPKNNGYKYKINIVFEIEGQEKPACIAEWLALAYAG